VLKSKSEELAKSLGHNDFKATDGWLSRLKSRFGIKLKKTHGEKGSADAVSAEQWKSTKLQDLLQKCCAHDLYNADETGLFYHAKPDGSQSYKHATVSDPRKTMEHTTVSCCSNMSRTDKRELFLLGKGQSKPRCFKGIRTNSLPVLYYANKNAWVTSEILRVTNELGPGIATEIEENFADS
jgi:hypothetical protein